MRNNCSWIYQVRLWHTCWFAYRPQTHYAFNHLMSCCELTHWGRVTHICVGKLTIIGSDNGLSFDRRQAIILTNAGILSIGPLRTYFSDNSIKIQQFSLKKMHMKMSSAKLRSLCLGLNVLKAFAWLGQNISSTGADVSSLDRPVTSVHNPLMIYSRHRLTYCAKNFITI